MMKILSPSHHALSIILLLTAALAVISGCSNTSCQVHLEKATVSTCWSSPCWGYNAPKIVADAQERIWIINMIGSYPAADAQILRRLPGGPWEHGRVFEGIYQPGMIFLDEEGRLNVINNYQSGPINHYRSTDDENLNNFELIARGDGPDAGRGWYIGIGVYRQMIYMSYITSDYKLWLTRKKITDSTWQTPILIFSGYASPEGNRSLLYPKFQFRGDWGYMMTSHTDDGSTHNTYNAIYLTAFPVSDPQNFSNEIVFQGHTGYYSFGFDFVIDEQGTFYIAHSAGKHSYGEIVPDEVSPGLYVSVKEKEGDRWALHQVENQAGCIALHLSPGGPLYALVTAGSWSEENHTRLKKSTTAGKTWEILLENVFQDHPEITHQFFTQSLQPHSGSEAKEFQVVFSTSSYEKNKDGLYAFDYYYLRIPVR